MDNNNYFTAEESAQILGLSRVSLYKLAREGKINTIKVGGKVLFPKEEIERYGSVNIEDLQLDIDVSNKKTENRIDYWMIPRSVRKLVTLQEMINNDYRNGIIGSQWKGTRTNHIIRDKNLQESGLRGKSLNGFVDPNPGGARTDVALLGALGFYAFDENGNIELTFQGEEMKDSTEPASIITQQLFQFRYPSPYSKSIKMDPDINIMPYRFLFRLLTSNELKDNGDIVADDGMIRLTQDEIALFVIVAKKDKDLKNTINNIVEYRKNKSLEKPNKKMANIANTFINNIEITGYIERGKKSSVWVNENSINEVIDLLEKKARNFRYEVGKEKEFQHKFGMDPNKKKFTGPQTANNNGAKMAVKHILVEEFKNNPLTKDIITSTLIENLASRVGTSKDTVINVLNTVLKEDPKDIFSKQYLEYSSSGRSFARDFEITTTKIIQDIVGNAKWTGKEGKSPDITFQIENTGFSINYLEELPTYNGIIDCKAEKKYNISNDHFNRMTVDDSGYIPSYKADFFVYVANGFGTNFVRKLRAIEEKCNVKGCGITAEDLLELLEKNRNTKLDNESLIKLFTIGRVINISDINSL
ncbi:AlwI family type II restriction endonuclease [Metaclostridioides mangenotii]|uniref:AlwI family type II restriction endonuclease n=1 Tax=Metaclostridioides mangenotii TaxID=1540 RepID=UPI0026EE9C40|nr:AlwI family type II restriction endonuclease [Clostridioides mangenotii]